MANGMKMRWRAAALLAPLLFLPLAACMGGGQRTAGNDPPVYPYPWCANERREAASQPVPKGASREEEALLRGRHMSMACASAGSRNVNVKFSEPVPNPLPRPRPQP